MTADEGRELTLTVPPGLKQTYRAELYLDDPAAGPNALTRRDAVVPPDGRLTIAMPPSGGFAARLVPAAGDGRPR